MIAKMLEDSNGNTSSMRVMSVVALIEACAIGGYMVVEPPSDPATGIYVFTAFLIAAFAPKTLQKFVENRYPGQPKEDRLELSGKR